MIKRAFYCCLVAIAVAGCQRPETTSAGDGWYGSEVRLVRLEDGARCAVMVGYQRGGIDCEWSR